MNGDRVLADAFRRRGDLQADLDPLGRLKPYDLRDALDACGGRAEIVRVQEEPASMRAESFVRRRIQRLAGDRHVSTVHRSASAGPATGSAEAHRLQQETLLALPCATRDRDSQ